MAEQSPDVIKKKKKKIVHAVGVKVNIMDNKGNMWTHLDVKKRDNDLLL